VLYVNLTQVFAIWTVPFHRAEVNLDVRLQLTQHRHSEKYYIAQQNDLYAVDQWIKFVLPLGIGTFLVAIWHFITLVATVLGAIVATPIVWLEQSWADQRSRNGNRRQASVTRGREEVKRLILGTTEEDTAVQQFGNMQVIT
jgi:hypothetical protein